MSPWIHAKARLATEVFYIYYCTFYLYEEGINRQKYQHHLACLAFDHLQSTHHWRIQILQQGLDTVPSNILEAVITHACQLEVFKHDLNKKILLVGGPDSDVRFGATHDRWLHS